MNEWQGQITHGDVCEHCQGDKIVDALWEMPNVDGVHREVTCPRCHGTGKEPPQPIEPLWSNDLVDLHIRRMKRTASYASLYEAGESLWMMRDTYEARIAELEQARQGMPSDVADTIKRALSEWYIYNHDRLSRVEQANAWLDTQRPAVTGQVSE